MNHLLSLLFLHLVSKLISLAEAEEKARPKYQASHPTMHDTFSEARRYRLKKNVSTRMFGLST